MKGKKILIVEDKETVQRAFTRLFKRRGAQIGCPIEVFSALTITEAEKVLKEHPDLDGVLLDASLGTAQETDEHGRIRPDLAVIAFLKYLRTRHPRALPIVASSGDADCNKRLVTEGATLGEDKTLAAEALFNILFPLSAGI